MSHGVFRLAYLELILIYSKGQLGHKNGVSPDILAFLLYPGTIIVCKKIVLIKIYIDLQVLILRHCLDREATVLIKEFAFGKFNREVRW